MNPAAATEPYSKISGRETSRLQGNWKGRELITQHEFANTSDHGMIFTGKRGLDTNAPTAAWDDYHRKL